MIVLRFKMRCQPEKTEQAQAAFQEVIAASRPLGGVISFDIGRDLSEPDSFVGVEVFEDRAALDRRVRLDGRPAQEMAHGPAAHRAPRTTSRTTIGVGSQPATATRPSNLALIRTAVCAARADSVCVVCAPLSQPVCRLPLAEPVAAGEGCTGRRTAGSLDVGSSVEQRLGYLDVVARGRPVQRRLVVRAANALT